ncbi:MAG: hypothetical protein KDB03_11610 [Planctomycetales bacterium]|nr:hypothetical protein [Planctomycetales bacterium]
MQIPQESPDPNRVALLISHPAHELFVWGWLQRFRPTVYVLTTGSSYGKPSRLARTEALLTELNCGKGDVFGALHDQTLYRDLLEGKTTRLVDIAHRLAQSLVDNRIQTVVGDAAEGEILTHDVWRAMIDTAVQLAQSRVGQEIQNLEFQLERHEFQSTSWVHIEKLDTERLNNKVDSIRRYVEVSSESDRIIALRGLDSLQYETLSLSQSAAQWLVPKSEQTGYERHAAELVRSGRYREKIQLDRHVLPFVQLLASECDRAQWKLAKAS